MNQINVVARLAMALLLAATLAVPAAANINKSIKIEPGAQAGSQSSVNGSIRIGSGAIIDGSVETVNGAITIEENARVENAETVNGGIRLESGAMARNVNSVNGAIRIADNVTVDGEVSVVNGKISSETGSRVAGDTSNVNGEILLIGSYLGGNLSTVNGDIELRDGTVLSGDLVVEKPGGWGWKNRFSRNPRVVIGPGSRVEGTLLLEREVDLFISETAEVGGVRGEMSMDDAVRFSGERP